MVEHKIYILFKDHKHKENSIEGGFIYIYMVEIILLWYNDTNLHSSYIFHSLKQIKFDKISEQQRVNIIKMIKGILC
jgi:hypothetical protein